MTSRYEGGLGTRDGGDMVRWSLDIDSGVDSVYAFGSRYPQAVQARAPEATLTLHAVSREECEAVVALLNQMRGKYESPAPRAPSIGDRFRGLEI